MGTDECIMMRIGFGVMLRCDHELEKEEERILLSNHKSYENPYRRICDKTCLTKKMQKQQAKVKL